MKSNKISNIIMLILIITFLFAPYIILVFDVFGIIAVVAMIVIEIIAAYKERNKPKKVIKVKDLYTISDIEVGKYIPNFDWRTFKPFVFSRYEAIQKAFCETDMENLKKYCDTSLLKRYQKNLKLMQEAKSKKIVHDFEKISLEIPRIRKKDTSIFITARVALSCYEYIMDEKQMVISGSKDKKTIYNLELDFKLPIDSENLKCSSCGASLEDIYDDECDYCDSVIYNEQYDYILVDERCISKDIK